MTGRRWSPPQEWMATLGRGARVVVLDSGFAPGTPHLYPAEVRSFTAAHGGPPDAATAVHGTRVAQIIASAAPECPGLAPACTLYVGEVVGPLRHGWASLHEALDWAIALEPDVLNMSFACPTSDQACDRRLAHLDAAGTVCLASYNQWLHWPHGLPHVAAVGLNGLGGNCDVRTVGEVLVPAGDRLDTFRGTSAASAVVAGVAACAKARNPALDRAGFLAAFRGFEGIDGLSRPTLRPQTGRTPQPCRG